MHSKTDIEEMTGNQPPEVTSSTHSYPSAYDDYYDPGESDEEEGLDEHVPNLMAPFYSDHQVSGLFHRWNLQAN